MTGALIYHDVVPGGEPDAAGFPGPLARRYKHTPEQFAAHLDAIASTGARVGLIDADSPPPAVALTFDDGGASALEIARRLEERGWRGHFFVTTGRIGTPGFLDSKGLRELVARGHDVGSHSHTHPTYMGRLAQEEIEEEWTCSRIRLKEVLGEKPTTAAIPGGYGGAVVVAAAARAGYRVLMTSDPRGRVEMADGIRVVGRCTIWATTPPEVAAAYARGDPVARARLRAEWALKGLAKRTSPRMYDVARRLRARKA